VNQPPGFANHLSAFKTPADGCSIQEKECAMQRIARKAIVPTILVAAAMVLIPITAATASGPSDKEITGWIQDGLREDPRVSTADIRIDTESGIVRLTGSVWSLAEKNYADLEAKKIKGVRGVINELNVWPSHRSDVDLAQAIRRRLIDSSFINSHNLGVAVKDGVVTLTGNVDSWSERQEADLLATDTWGVKEVVNEVTVAYKSDRPDEAIHQDVRGAINRDVYLCGLPINVDVKDGTVTLQGRVDNAYEKQRAWSDARWVDNVKDVQNKLTVEWWDNDGVRAKVPVPTDDQLKEAVHTELYQDLRVPDPFCINVAADLGHVTLRGTVPTYYQKRIAGQDARDVVGVAWVSDLLTVRTDRRDDGAIRDDLQFELSSDYVLNGQGIGVKVKDGIATLNGSVNTFYEKVHAADVASHVRGIRDVVNCITVNRTDQYTDAGLKQRVMERLASNWETRWVNDKIDVTVHDGKATLSGDVNTWAERSEAARVALMTAGVWAVEDKLTVQGVNYPWEEWSYSGPEAYAYGPYPEYQYYVSVLPF
jgi:osmotically-inducible protein OsmY